MDRDLRAIRIGEVLLLFLLWPPACLASAMGLGGEGPRGPLFGLLRACYLSILLYPVLFLAATILTVQLVKFGHRVAGFVCQAAPVLIPIALGLLVWLAGSLNLL
jgi:hypothetical protein